MNSILRREACIRVVVILLLDYGVFTLLKFDLSRWGLNPKHSMSYDTPFPAFIYPAVIVMNRVKLAMPLLDATNER